VDFDSTLLHRIIQLRQPWLDDVMVLASALAAGGFVWVVMALIASVFPRYRAGAWRLLLTIGVSLIVTDYVMKPIFERPRPFVVIADLPVIVGKPASPSFPSGHAARAVAGAIAGSRLLPGAGWVLWPFGILVAVSRVYVGVHWPTDVAAGALVGLVGAWWVTGRLTEGRPPGMN
jgi:undecaprenyl-diphosphatase